MQRFFLGLSLSIASLASPARAGELVHTTNVGPLATGASAPFTVPPFDTTAGILRNVSFQVTSTISGSIGFENTSTTSGYSIDGPNNGVLAQVACTIAGLIGNTAGPSYWPPSASLLTYDGVTDYAGASGVTVNYADPVPNGTQVGGGLYSTDAELQAFVGASPVAGQIGPIGRLGPTSANGVLVSDSMSVTTVITVRYRFDPVPAYICGAGVWSGCPCGNLSITGPDRGCRNSTGASGLLAIQGTASLSNDTLAIFGGGMTNSSALYFQGAGFRHAQTVYGDGLLCVTGTIRRLGTRTNAGGVSTVPGPGGTPISVLGAVTSPGTRYYQVVYRDLGNYCTPSTFNVTSGMAIAWSL